MCKYSTLLTRTLPSYLMMGKWTNILVHHQWHPCHQGVCLSQLQVSLAHRQSWRHRLVLSALLLHQTINRAGYTAQRYQTMGLSTAYSHHCYLVTYTDCQSVYHMFWEHWTSPRTWSWRHEPCLLVSPFGTTARNLHLVDLVCCQALAWLLEDTQPHSLTRFASCRLIPLRYLVVSQMGQVRKHELVLSCDLEHMILLCALQGCVWSPSLPWLLAGRPWTQDFQGNTYVATCSHQLVSFWVA